VVGRINEGIDSGKSFTNGEREKSYMGQGKSKGQFRRKAIEHRKCNKPEPLKVGG